MRFGHRPIDCPSSFRALSRLFCRSSSFAYRIQICLGDLSGAYLAEGERLVGNALQTALVDVARAIHVAEVALQIHRVVDPKVDVASPEALLLAGRHVLDRSLVGVDHLVLLTLLLQHPQVVEPHVVVVRRVAQRLLVLCATCVHDRSLHCLTVAELLLEERVLGVPST